MKVRMAGGFLLERTGKVSDRVTTYGSGRVCAAPGCGTVLSSYNPALCCSLHVAAAVPRPHVWVTDRPSTSRPQ
jgi:hypothetical protein